MTTPDDPYEGRPAPEHGSMPQEPPVYAPTPSPQQPQYYGQPPAQYYGPPKPPSRVAWFFIGAGSMLGVGVVGIIGFFIIVGILLGEDFGDYEDSYYYVDQRSVVDAVVGPCSDMQSAGRDINVFSDPTSGSADIKRFTIEIQGIVDAIDASDPDSDSRQWRNDWKALASDLDTYADDLVTDGADAEFVSRTQDEEPRMARMAYSSDADCELPKIIEAFDPELADF